MPSDPKKCPNCNGELETTDAGLFCPPCDLTYVLSKGRVKAEPGGKGRIQELEETVAELQNDNQKIKKELFGNSIPFWMQ